MDLGFAGRVVIVTGGASNIGRAIAQAFAAEGAHVAIFDRDLAMGERTTHEIVATGGAATFSGVDLTDQDATTAAVVDVERDLGPVAVLVNNVGWNGPAKFFLDLDQARWDQAYRLNMLPTFIATRAALPRMVELHLAGDADMRAILQGSINQAPLFFSSARGLLGRPPRPSPNLRRPGWGCGDEGSGMQKIELLVIGGMVAIALGVTG